MTLSTTALAHYDAPKLAAALERAEARIRALEQENSTLRTELRWIDRLLAVPASIMSPSHKVTLRAAVKAYQQGTPDEDGLIQIESWKLCKTVGQSRQTFLDNLTYCVEKLGILTKKRERLVDSDTNDYTTNLYLGVTPRLSHPQDYKVEQPRNHGGERQLCPHCHSDRLQRKVTMTCMNCGSVLDEKVSLVNQGSLLGDSPASQLDDAANEQAPVDQKPLPDTNVNLTPSKTNVLVGQLDDSERSRQEPPIPPLGGEGGPLGQGDQQADGEVIPEEQHEQECQAQPVDPPDLVRQAAQLLVAIAGPEPVHLDMSAVGPDKYYPVRRALTLQDARAHLGGWKTKGASLRHPDGMTRALCYDADHADTWEQLLDAARFLAEAGYQVLVEDSPAGRGGHLWIIYTGLVKATWAQRHALEVAPMLHSIKEAWPGTHRNKVRLPGGKYVKPGFAAWCRLHDAHGARLAENGREAARAMLTCQTPAQIVPAYPEPQAVRPGNEPARLPNDTDQAQDSNTSPVAPHKTAGVDQHWQQMYSPQLWFHFTPAMLAAWYNERHQVQELLPAEQNGRGVATWRGERSASVGLREDGWVDFGASARREDGKQDGGDALELAVRLSREPKPDVMRELGRQLKSEACEALERAAQRGEPPPEWVKTFMSPAGWERYHQLLEEAGHSDQAAPMITEPVPTGGVAGFHSNSALAAPYPDQTQDTPEALAAEIGAELGEPCTQCGCTLYYRSGEYQMCHWCLPRPAKFGRLSDEQHARLRALVKTRNGSRAI